MHPGRARRHGGGTCPKRAPSQGIAASHGTGGMPRNRGFGSLPFKVKFNTRALASPLGGEAQGHLGSH